ncbi:DUF4241 domain-containing protein, partial [Streptomyces sp. NPDC007095]|uniref:DUF4241 domain-containing protein n=1 Tax=Streptomyces sp. NPDC007095 TaxID=3154482 RepID=UPI0033C3C7A4
MGLQAGRGRFGGAVRRAGRWRYAGGQDERVLRDGQFYGFGVDAGTGAFVDATMAE